MHYSSRKDRYISKRNFYLRGTSKFLLGKEFQFLFYILHCCICLPRAESTLILLSLQNFKHDAQYMQKMYLILMSLHLILRRLKHCVYTKPMWKLAKFSWLNLFHALDTLSWYLSKVLYLIFQTILGYRFIWVILLWECYKCHWNVSKYIYIYIYIPHFCLSYL